MWKTVLPAIVLATLALAAGAFGVHATFEARQPIVVGLLHAQSASERSVLDAELLALEALNKAGGLLGRPVKWAIYRNLNAWRSFVLGKIRADGQFDIVYSLPKPIPPVPFPRTRSHAEWEGLLGEMNHRWGGQWTAPAALPARVTTTP